MPKIKRIREKIKNGWLKEFGSELQWLCRYDIRYRKSILWYLFLGMFGILMSLSGSVVSKYVIDAVMAKNAARLLTITVIFVLMQLLGTVSHIWTGKVSAEIGLTVNQQIKSDVYDSIMEADWEAISEFHSADLVNRIEQDVGSVTECVIGWVPGFCTNILQFVGALGIILYYDPTLAVLALLSAPVTIAMSRILVKKLRIYNKELRQANANVMVFNEESFHNIQTIKSFGLTDTYGEKLREVQQRYYDLKMRYTKFTLETSAVMSVLGTIVGLGCMGWGVYRLWTGNITFGTMALFLQMSRLLTSVFQKLLQMVPNLISSATAAGRIMAVSELKKESRKNGDQIEQLLESGEGIVIEADGIGFSYATGKNVLEEEAFVARPGELVAVVGSSGAGKTTLLRILLGLISVKKGTVTVSGADSRQKIAVNAATRDLCAYVPQDNTMFAGTVAANMRAVKKDASNEEIDEALKIACAYDFIHSLPDGIESPIKEKGGGFSEGQIQRLSIARAVLSDRPVMLLDEATSALDTATEQQVLKNVMDFRKNKTCIVTTHKASVLRACSRVYRIEDHKIITS